MVKDIAVQAKKIGKIYPDGSVGIHPSDFEIRQGELVFIIGSSGAGKTTTINLLLGIEKPSTGEVTLLGNLVAGSEKERRRIRRQVGIVFQNFRLIESATALENVILPLRFSEKHAGAYSKTIYDAGEQALSKCGMKDYANKRVSLLSHGEKQRVSIARAIVTDPKIIIADEPTANLDPKNAELIIKLLASLTDEGRTVIITTHAQHLIEFFPAHRLMIIEDGCITMRGTK